MRPAPLSLPRSPAFKAHAAAWALAGCGALLYIGSIIHGASAPSEARRGSSPAAGDTARLETRLVGHGEDLRELRGKLAAGEESANALLARVAALEEKSALLSTAASAPPAIPLTTAAVPSAEPKPTAARRPAEITTGAILQRTGTPSPAAAPEAPPTLTLTPLPAPARAVVTGAGPAPENTALPVGAAPPPPPKVAHGIQLSSATNLDALRLNWSLLNERHRALGPLQTRYRQTPGKPNAPFQLIAGPVRSAAEAAKICKELAASGVACRATTFTGEAL